MAEAFELVRIVRQHIRRSAMLLDRGKLSEALAEADAALALDPQSLPAQAMRDRITSAQATASGAVKSDARREIPTPPRAYVPYGVNAASWRGFEQRVTERRFKALLESVNTSMAAGDGVAARTALAEARELRPAAPEVNELETRVAAMPVVSSSATRRSSPHIWMRAMGAAALFLIGVSMLLGLEWMRPVRQPVATTPAPAAAPALPAAAPGPKVQDTPPAPSLDIGSVPVAMHDDETVPAVVTPPEPLLRPAGTSGEEVMSSPASRAPAAPPPAEPPPSRPAPAPAIANTRPADSAPGPQRAAAEDAPRTARADVAGDFVAPRQALVVAPDAGPAVSPTAPPRAIVDTPVPATSRGSAPAAAASVTPAAISIPSGIDQQTRVEEVLRRYARAYDRLDASAARAVWPTVDERALARAFQNLSSQNVSLENCEIDIRGAVANASCSGQASYAPKVGNREPRTEARNWRFELRREGDAWQIVQVEARR